MGPRDTPVLNTGFPFFATHWHTNRTWELMLERFPQGSWVNIKERATLSCVSTVGCFWMQYNVATWAVRGAFRMMSTIVGSAQLSPTTTSQLPCWFPLSFGILQLWKGFAARWLFYPTSLGFLCRFCSSPGRPKSPVWWCFNTKAVFRKHRQRLTRSLVINPRLTWKPSTCHPPCKWCIVVSSPALFNRADFCVQYAPFLVLWIGSCVQIKDLQVMQSSCIP